MSREWLIMSFTAEIADTLANKMTHSKLLAANSFNRFTSSVSLASVESISASFLNSTALLRFGSFQITFYQLPDAPPPPLLPPPNPPNPPPPPQPPDPPPNPPPFHPPPQDPRREVLAIIPSKNHSRPLPPDPPPRNPRPPEARPRSENKRNSPTKSQKSPPPPPLLLCRIRRTGGSPLKVTFASSAMYFANCHAPISTASP